MTADNAMDPSSPPIRSVGSPWLVTLRCTAPMATVSHELMCTRDVVAKLEELRRTYPSRQYTPICYFQLSEEEYRRLKGSDLIGVDPK